MLLQKRPIVKWPKDLNRDMKSKYRQPPVEQVEPYKKPYPVRVQPRKGHSGKSRKNTKGGRNWPLPMVVALDILLVGIGLIIFALFHHVIPQDVGLMGQALPTLASGTPAAVTTASSSGQIEGTTFLTEPLSGVTKNTQSEIQSSSSQGSSTVTTKPEQPRLEGAFAEKFKSRFTTGAVEKTADSYKSAHVNLTVKKVSTGNIAYFVIDIYVADLKYFRTAFATGKYARGFTNTVLEMDKANQAIAAISGDYYGIRDKGIVIRNGVLYRDKLYRDVLIMNNDGSMQTFTAAEFDIKNVLKNGAWQGWSFGPMLLKDGKPMTTFNSDVNVENPRGAIGYFEPGHYCFVLVDGRQPGYSDGMTTRQLSKLFFDLG